MLTSMSSATPILFHFTYLESLNSILRSDQFLLTTSIANDAESDISSNYTYYLSLTRSRLGKYHIGRFEPGSILITLDGTKLNQRYRIKPVDYWGHSYRKHANGSYEAEDRLLSLEPVLNNARQYITNIDIAWSQDLLRDPKASYLKMLLKQCLMLCKKYKIPYRIFTDSKDWLTGNAAKAAKLDTTYFKTSLVMPAPEYKYLNRGTTAQKWKGLKQKSNAVGVYLELYNSDKYANLSGDGKQLVDGIKKDWSNLGLATFKNAISYHKSGADDERKYIVELTRILKREGISLMEFYNILKAKWS